MEDKIPKLSGIPEFPNDDPVYWIMSFPFYGKFVFYGTEVQANELFKKKCEWEGSAGILRRANPGISEDWTLVNKEISAVREDRSAGIKIDYLPREGGF